MEQSTPSAPAPSALPAPVAPPAPSVAPNTLAEFRAERAKSLAGELTPSAPPPPPQAAGAEPPEPLDIGDDDPPPPAQLTQEPGQPPKPPEQGTDHRWRDPETGIRLDMRRRDHRQMKRALEDRAALARRIEALETSTSRPDGPQEPLRQPPQAVAADPSDPEPTLEQFAEEPDPYLAHSRALARWDARQEFRSQQATHTQVERARAAQRAINQAQAVYDADLPAVRQRYADFDEAHTEVLETLGRLPMSARAPLVHRLLTSSVKHDLTHYLGSHPEDLAAVVEARNSYEQAIALGAIETRVRALVNQRAKPAPQTPTPPPAAPMAPVGGTASPVAMPDGRQMTLAQYRANKHRLGVSA